MARSGARTQVAAAVKGALTRPLRRHRRAVANGSALVLAAGCVVALAVTADGQRSHDARLNDGGIWVTSTTHGYYGRVNKPIGQLDAGLFAEVEADLDVVQDGGTVLGVNRSAGTLAPIDTAVAEHPEGSAVGLPGSADVVAAGGTVAVVDPVEGHVWAAVDAQDVSGAAVPAEVATLDRGSRPVARVGGVASAAATTGGDVLVLSAGKDTLTRLERDGGTLADPVRRRLPEPVGDAAELTAVGDVPVVLDPGAGRLWALDGDAPRSDVPVGGVLQQRGPEAVAALVATSGTLLEVPLAGGEAEVVAEAPGGRPARPVRLGACRYGAWAGGGGTVVTACDGAEPVLASLGATTGDLVFRVNRGQVVLNDRLTGAVWNIDSDQPTRLDDWDDFNRRATEDDEDREQENESEGDQRPPVANPDTLGARPGRTTVLHPLDNDTAPGGRLLSIRSVERVRGPGAEVTISPDGQTAQITLPPDARGRAGFVYHIDDGRDDRTDSATVSVPVRPDGENRDPALRPGYEPARWTVPAGGVLDVPVLPDWRDRADGDPLAVTGAEAVGGERSGAEARTTASGRVRFTAPAQGGPVRVEYTVSDGIGADVRRSFRVDVQGPKDRKAYPGVAEPDVITGQVGEPIRIRPLDNDRPGSDPVTPDARLAIAGRLRSPGGTEVVTDLVQGTVTVTAPRADTYFLDYDAAYGNAPLSAGTIRVDVRNPERPPDEPVAMPDTALLTGQESVLVDVLANDLDPAGGMLTVQRAAARNADQLDVTVVDGQWLRIAARQGRLRPSPQVVRYEITNGTRSGVRGEVVVTQRDAPDRDVPVTEKDTATVRAGASVAVPVLDNDHSPSGGELALVEQVDEEGSGRLTVRRAGDEEVPVGQAFVAGGFVRYVAPARLADAQTFTVGYVAENAEGVRAPGTLEVTVVPGDRPNQPPEPPSLDGRVVAGDTVTLRLPGTGVDPDGDAVTLLGLGSAPRLGRVVRTGADSLVYQAFPGSAGTDRFEYRLTDTRGGTAAGTVRVGVTPPDLPQAPLAVDDVITVEPGRRATVDILANDHVASGDRVTATLVDPPPGVRLESGVGPLLMTAPDEADGRNLEVVYEVSNGLDDTRGVVTLRTAEPYNNPPVAFDAFGDAADGDRIQVDVLRTAYDPDGDASDLTVAEVMAPPGVTADVADGVVTVTRGPEPAVVPFRVEDADGGATTASVYVPPAGAALPFVPAGRVVSLDPGEQVEADLADHVENPAGGPLRFTLRDRAWAGPAGTVGASITGEGTFLVQAADGYEGPGAVTFEVTTGTSVDDPEGRTAVVTVPVQVGETRPVLRCPDTPLEIPQGTVTDVDLTSVCHVWTAQPGAADDLEFTVDWISSVDGLAIVRPRGRLVTLGAASDAVPGVTAELEVTTGDAEPAVLPVRVVDSPPPTLAPIRVADMRADETRTLDLAPYLGPAVPNPVPTLVRVDQETGLDIAAERTGPAELTLTTGPRVDGTARFRVLMSDVEDPRSAERQVTGYVELEVLDVPDVPTVPVPGRTVRSQEVALSWRAPEANGAPIERYEVRDNRGDVTRCASTSCDVTGLTNGQRYRFQVRAVNAVGESDWSGMSAPAVPDARPGIVGPVQMVGRGDGRIDLRWTPPTTETSPIRRYLVSWKGGGERTAPGPRISIRGLDNDVARTFTVVAENDLAFGPPRVSDTYQSIGTPGTPAAPTVTDQQTGDGQTAVTVAWDQVGPNGPGPVQYTVLRNGRPLPACTRIEATRCDDAGITYDGTGYTYAVRATNNGGRDDAQTSPVGPGTRWDAVGRPAVWDEGWTATPTGQDTMTRVDFTVPPSRGAESRVEILVDGAVRNTAQRTGRQSVALSVGDNDRAHGIALRVCNEKQSCSTSGTKSVQAYGPLVNAHVLGVSGSRSGSSTQWRITVDSNGNPALVRITSDRGLDQTFRASSVDVSTFSTAGRDIGYRTTENVTVTLFDDSPGGRGQGTRTASVTTGDPPPATARVWRYEKCNDSTGAGGGCYGGSGTPCVNPSCGRIAIAVDGFAEWGSSSVTCRLHDDLNNEWWGRDFPVTDGRTDYTTAYYGYPNGTVTAHCGNGSTSTTFTYAWPDG